MGNRSGRIGLALSVMVLLLPASPRAQDAEGELQSVSFLVRMFALNSSGYRQVQSGQFRGSCCVGELGGHLHASPSFQLLTGSCARWFWLSADSTGEQQPSKPFRTVLGAPMPNPSHGPVFLPYSIKEGEAAALRIYDMGGRLVRTLAEDSPGPILRIARWDLNNNRGKPVGSGVYLVRLGNGAAGAARRFVVLRR